MRIRVVSLSIVVGLLILVLALAVSAAMAGNPEPPSPPGSTSSYTLEAIYQRLDTGAPGGQSMTGASHVVAQHNGSFTARNHATGTGDFANIVTGSLHEQAEMLRGIEIGQFDSLVYTVHYGDNAPVQRLLDYSAAGQVYHLPVYFLHDLFSQLSRSGR